MADIQEFEASDATFILAKNGQAVAYTFATDKGPVVVTMHRELFRILSDRTKRELTLEFPRAPEL